MKKGRIEEIFDKARFADNPEEYKIFYRDFERILEKTLSEFFIESEGFKKIPVSRIVKIERNNTVLFEKRKE